MRDDTYGLVADCCHLSELRGHCLLRCGLATSRRRARVLGRPGSSFCLSALACVSRASQERRQREQDGERRGRVTLRHDFSALHRDFGAELAYFLLSQGYLPVQAVRTPGVTEHDPAVRQHVLDEVRVTTDEISALVRVDVHVGPVVDTLRRDDHNLARVDPSADVRRARLSRVNIVRLAASEDLDRLVRPVGIDVLVAAGAVVTIIAAAREGLLDVGGPVLRACCAAIGVA